MNREQHYTRSTARVDVSLEVRPDVGVHARPYLHVDQLNALRAKRVSLCCPLSPGVAFTAAAAG